MNIVASPGNSLWSGTRSDPYCLEPTGSTYDEWEGPVHRRLAMIATRDEAHFRFPTTRNIETAEARFTRLADDWSECTALYPRIIDRAMDRSYQEIIAMGATALPHLLRRLEQQPDQWFWALKVISGIDPVPPEDRGDFDQMRDHWIRWGRRDGLIS